MVFEKVWFLVALLFVIRFKESCEKPKLCIKSMAVVIWTSPRTFFKLSHFVFIGIFMLTAINFMITVLIERWLVRFIFCFLIVASFFIVFLAVAFFGIASLVRWRTVFRWFVMLSFLQFFLFRSIMMFSMTRFLTSFWRLSTLGMFLHFVWRMFGCYGIGINMCPFDCGWWMSDCTWVGCLMVGLFLFC